MLHPSVRQFSLLVIVRWALFILSAVALGRAATAYDFRHFAGSVDGTRGSDDGQGDRARFYTLGGLAVDSAGNLYVADYPTIRKITPDAVVTTLAGRAGFPGSADGVGSDARFYLLERIAIDAVGNIYAADWGNATIRKITASGMVMTLAGSPGQRGDSDGQGAAARFNYSSDLTGTLDGTLYVADQGNNNIRKITSNGVVTTVAGYGRGNSDGIGLAAQFSAPYGLCLDTTGALVVADTGNSLIRKISADGVVTKLAGTAGSNRGKDGVGFGASFGSIAGLTFDRAGNLYSAEAGDRTIRKMTPDRKVTTIGGAPGACNSDRARSHRAQ